MPKISNPDNDIVVGFKKEEETIINQLIHGSKKREVVLITGMSGLGKTTLARRVYEKKNVVNHFYKRAWCTVSQEYDCKNLLNKICNEVCGRKTEIDSVDDDEELCKSVMEIDCVADELRKSLMERRYLIVLDDIWSEKAWEELNRVFPLCDNGSRIVLTSRQESVVSDAKHIRLPFFTIDESWELLQVKLFKGKECLKELENVGKEICNKCKGLPLTVSLIAGLLEKVEKSEQMWFEFLLNLNSHVAFGDGIQSNDAIKLSYNNLAYPLKLCLLYFAAFPEDRVIRVPKLIQLWISEGFIGMREKGRVEDVALDYLNHLVTSNLVIMPLKEYGWFPLCMVHDLVHDFCLTKAREENFLDVINMEKNWDSILKCTPHRICFHQEIFDISSDDELVPWNSSIKTILVFHHYGQLVYNVSWIATNFEHLTILDLEGICVYQSFLSEVNLLIHLRYLALFVYGDEDDVTPLSLRNLKCLITLRLCSNTVHFPIFFINMGSLRHMIITGASCDKSCLEKSGSVMIEAIPCSNELQAWVLPCPLTSTHEHLLRKLPNLKILEVGFSTYPFPKIDFLHDLVRLKLIGSSESYPHLLKDLELNKFPSSLGGIRLNFITLSVSAISTIAQLPNLVNLWLSHCKFEEGFKWNVEEETKFPKLKGLQLIFLDIEIWDVSCAAESFPCLEQLVLGYCANLLVMPSSFEDVLTLKVICVKDCNLIVDIWAMEIEKCAREIGNEKLNVEILRTSGINFEHEPMHDDNPESNSEYESIHDDNLDSNSEPESIYDTPNSNSEQESIPDSNFEQESFC